MLKRVSGNNKLISDNDLLLLSEKVVARYVKAGTIPDKDKEDVKMAIVEKFLIKHDSIKKAFNGKSKTSTYCIAILNRMCCEIIRKELKHWKNSNEELPDIEESKNSGFPESVIINDEANLLGKILLIFNDDYAKLKLFLAFFYQLNLKPSDIEAYGKHVELRELLNVEIVKNKGKIFQQLAKVVNVIENKELKPDAIRMWLNKYIDKIILRLNGSFGRANYDRETFQILFEYYYSEMLNVNQDIKKGA